MRYVAYILYFTENSAIKVIFLGCPKSYSIDGSNHLASRYIINRLAYWKFVTLKKKPELEKRLFLEEEKSLICAIAESIARLVEREWAEAEIRRCRNKIEELIKQAK